MEQAFSFHQLCSADTDQWRGYQLGQISQRELRIHLYFQSEQAQISRVSSSYHLSPFPHQRLQLTQSGVSFLLQKQCTQSIISISWD